MTVSERLVSRISTRSKSPTSSRRGFLGGAALVGAALAAELQARGVNSLIAGAFRPRGNAA